MSGARHVLALTLYPLVCCTPDAPRPSDSPTTTDTAPRADSRGDSARETGDTQPGMPTDTADSAPWTGCELGLELDGDRHVLDWTARSDRELAAILFTTSWYDGMVSRSVRATDTRGSLALLPHALEGHTLQDELGATFTVRAAATLTDGDGCEHEASFPFLESDDAVLPYLPVALELEESATGEQLEQALEGRLVIRVVAMAPSGSGYTHFLVVQDLLGTPLRILSVTHDMVDAVSEDPLGFAILTGAGAHDGRVYAMIDSFPYLQVGTTLILDALTGKQQGFLPTPEDQLLNHRFSVRGDDDGQTVMDALAWRLTDESEANTAVEVRFTPASSQVSADSIETWFDPIEELNLVGLLYCNSTAASPDWQVVTCPNDNGFTSDDPMTELIVALDPDTRERMVFVREGYRGQVLAEGAPKRFETIVELPDHPEHAEPVMNMVHDAVIQGDRIAILSLQLEGTTEQPTSVYLLDFDAQSGTASFHCGYQSDLQVEHYGNLFWPEGSPLIGLHLPNSGGFRWIDQDCQLAGALRAPEDWETRLEDIFHQKWLEPAQAAELGHPDSTISYQLRSVPGSSG